jgi:hypothetical protein
MYLYGVYTVLSIISNLEVVKVYRTLCAGYMSFTRVATDFGI